MKGYKAFDKNLKCRGFQYEIGKTYEMDEKPKACNRGFHFCQTVADCYNYYEMSEDTRICEVEALGDIDTDDEIKYATNKIAILSEILDEQLRRGNAAKNEGYRNTGNRNTGNRNTGNWNTGNWNTGNWNTGCFCTDENPKIKLFDKESDWTINDWRNSSARYILDECPCTNTEFVWKSDMTQEEKEKHPECDKIGGYLKTIVATKDDKQKWWDELSDMKKKIIKSIPNFDDDKFVECIGIDHI